ncbi:MAG: hypothetical protein CBC84_001155 [Pelagibacteraceae bacterium TMED124]|nr:MAG: hypothetical protein CBC84_001155 [Pelagibacteraceae bacterium TMED124]|tara:strand:- start:10516 stop:11493 length:978 start_codon:yes stop_codon:yes gene_type:complete
MINRLRYWKRIFSTYLFGGKSNLSFWHGDPEINDLAKYNELDQYYMKFHAKAQYEGNYDNNGIPMLNYQGDIGIKYNPIAVSQWSLGNYNLWKKNNTKENYINFIKGADWLNENLETNDFNIYVWQHHFNWIYKEDLINPWYSGLAQGQGLSVLCRAYNITNEQKYLDSIEKVYRSFLVDVENGGVTFTDVDGDIWIEEYIMKNNPTHILNGFIWGLWGIYDYWLMTKNKDVQKLFKKYVKTINDNMSEYDIGYWSLYEISNLPIYMRASIFYHKLHIVQLKILFKMTNNPIFESTAMKWSKYLNNKINIIRATLMKIIFKIFYY